MKELKVESIKVERTENLAPGTILISPPLKGTNGHQIGCFYTERKIICTEVKWSLTTRVKNRMKRMINGNGKLGQNITVIHWNMRSKQWTNNIEEIELVISQYKPDIFLISEANLKMGLSDFEKDISGYKITVPLSADRHGLARLVMLSKDELEVKLLRKYMDETVASIWIKIAAVSPLQQRWQISLRLCETLDTRSGTSSSTSASTSFKSSLATD